MNNDNKYRVKIVFAVILIYLIVPQMDLHLYAGEDFLLKNVEIVVDGVMEPPAAFALNRFKQSLKKRQIPFHVKSSIGEVSTSSFFLIGTLDASAHIKKLRQSGELKLSENKESLAIQHINEVGKNYIVIAGSDERGLMYALLEMADQIALLPKDKIRLDHIKNRSESPSVPVRSMIVFLHNQDDERSWYYSQDYWEEYFGMLARNRWNVFNLVFSHQTPYLAPMYPFHVKVDAFPEVKAIGLSEEQREKNLEMLRFISSLAKERGLDFTLSVWQQIAWGIGTHTRTQRSMVSGYNQENMTEYTYLALAKLLKECPGISGLQLRLNYESGITYDEQPAFFKDAVFRAAREAGRPILIEVRDIGLLSDTLAAASATGLPVRVSHKYWAEHMIFPYHPASFVWTYSYGDWLRYPRDTDHIFQVWSLGSHRLLQWGDPEFVRRFAPTTTFQDAVGFEICAPIPQKGYGNAPGAWRIFRNKEHEYYKWEFQRYWSFYTLFGRLSYNPQTGGEFWTRELGRRFGIEAVEDIAAAFRSASQVVPLISSMAIGNYNMGTWPEKDMGGLINYYMSLKPYDRARFAGFFEYVDNTLAGRDSGKVGPLDVSSRLESIATLTEKSLNRAKTLVTGSEKEFWATDKDFRILSSMARYYSQKIQASTRLGFFYRTGDIGQLKLAVRHGEAAVGIWKELSAKAAEIYSDNLVFGPGSVGHWKDGIRFVEDDLEQMRYQEKLFNIVQIPDFAFDFGPRPFTDTTSTWSTTYTNDFMTERRFQGVYPTSYYEPAAGYGWIKSQDLSADEPEKIGRYVWTGARKYDGDLPGNALMGDFIQGSKDAIFRIDLPEGHYQVTAVITDQNQKPTDHGPMSMTVVERFGDRPIIDREVIRAGQTIISRFNINMIGERFITFRLKFSADPGADYIVNALMFTLVEPHIAHIPIRSALPDQDLSFVACITLPPLPNDKYPLTSLGIITSNASTLAVPKKIVKVKLKYALNSGNEFRSLDMIQSDDNIYKTTLLAEDLKAGSFNYYIEAQDSIGRIIRFPKEHETRPFFRTIISRDREAPTIVHSPAFTHMPEQSLAIKAVVTDDSGVSKVLLYYRPTRQTMDYGVIMMDKKGDEFTAAIPGEAITEEFDLMYYFEAFDEHGNACIYPDPTVTQPYFVVKVKR